VGDRLVATIGDTVTYTIWYNNTGHDTAATVWLNDTLSPNVQYVSSSVPYDMVSGTTYTWIIRNATPGDHYIKVSVIVLASAQFNTWLVNSVNETYTDSNYDVVNSTHASYAFRVQAPIILPAKQGAVSGAGNSIIAYTIYYNNTGIQTAKELWLNDTLPSYLSFVSASPTPSNVSGNVIRWHFTDVAVGTHSLTLTVKVLPGIFAGTKLRNHADVNYTDLSGNLMLPAWVDHLLVYPYGVKRFTFDKGTIIIPMDSMQDSGSSTDYYPAQVRAYGLVYWALSSGIPVFWAANATKGYGGPDFSALTDNDGNPNVNGTVIVRSYGGGPFLIRDPDPNTSYNEAWDMLKAIALKNGYMDVKIHELQAALMLDPWDVYELARAPRVALRNDSRSVGWTSPADQVSYLWNWSYGTSARIPMVNLTDADIRTGSMISSQGSGCASTNYDILVIGDEEFQSSTAFPQSDTLFDSLSSFVSSSGHVSLGCTGATLATRTSWFIKNATVYEENDITRGAALSIAAGMPGHPLMQTWGAMKANRGTFMAWDASNNWSNGVRPLAYLREAAPGDGTGEVWAFPDGYGSAPDVIQGTSEDDPAYLYDAQGSGIISSLGGHTQGTDTPNGAMTSSVQPRVLLDSVLYSVLTPRPRYDISPKFAQEGSRTNVTVLLGFDAGEFIWSGNLTLDLDTNVTLKGVELLVPWGSTSAGSGNATLAFSYYDPRFDPFVARVDLSVLVGSSSVQTLFSLRGTITDSWNTYDINSSGCAYIFPKLSPGHGDDGGPGIDADAVVAMPVMSSSTVAPVGDSIMAFAQERRRLTG